MGTEFYITKDQAERRLDRLLRTMYPGVSLGAIMKAIRKGDVRLDAKKAASDTRLAEGQFLQVPWETKTQKIDMSQESNNIETTLDVVYEDDYVIAVNKPAGLLTQPDVKGGDSLITRVLQYLKWSRTDFRPSSVQRLDRNTSGIILVPVTAKALRYLSELIRERRIKKIYKAVVMGSVPNEGEISVPLLKDSITNTVKPDSTGQSALTRYKKIESNGNISTVELELVTGRPHQARVHMAYIGHPIVGDVKYEGVPGTRPLLHAFSLEFEHDKNLPCPLRGAVITASIPLDMKKYF